MIADLLTPFHYDYLLKAIWVSALVGGACGFLSAFVTLKGWSLMGDALSHAVVPGVAVSYILGLPFVLGAFVAALLASGAMVLVRARSRIREDATIGIVFTSFFALGLVLISRFPSKVDLKMILFGNILGISGSDVIQVAVISALTLLVLGLKWRDLMLVSFDPAQARTLGLPAAWLQWLLLALLSATAVAALQAVGACLVVAMLVTPGATAYLLTDRFGRLIWLSTAMGAFTSWLGAYLSYHFNGATGGCIVVLQTLLFLVAFTFAPKHGWLAARRRVKQDWNPPLDT